MFLLVTGASGMGKSTARELVAPQFAPLVQAAELATLGVVPEWSLEWRQRMVERLVRLAIDVERDGRHFLLCGDPVPPGEVWAAPSAGALSELSVCLLDAGSEVQQARLRARGDDPALLMHHVAFADWMRSHVRDPHHRLDVIQGQGWGEMQWERLGPAEAPTPWRVHVIDTSALAPDAVAERVAAWIRRELEGNSATAVAYGLPGE